MWNSNPVFRDSIIFSRGEKLMKKAVLLPLIFLALFVLVVGSACALTGGKQAETQEPSVIIVTATPEAPVEVIATEPPAVVTEAPVVVTEEPVVATEEPAGDEPPDYFVEEFDNGLSNYGYFLMSGDEDKADVYTEDGKLKFNLDDDYIYYYLLYEPYTYGNVRVDAEVVNQASNNNEVSLLCRYSDDLGWYEFNITSGGLWRILWYDNVVAKDYLLIANGGSTDIRMGRDSNTYTAICKDRELSLYINGIFVKTVEDKNLDRGQVGVGIASFEAYPVIMNIPWLEISYAE
jgi:hypothetical protein